MRRGKVNWLIVTRGERGQWETKNKTELFTSYLMASPYVSYITADG